VNSLQIKPTRRIRIDNEQVNALFNHAASVIKKSIQHTLIRFVARRQQFDISTHAQVKWHNRRIHNQGMTSPIAANPASGAA